MEQLLQRVLGLFLAQGKLRAECALCKIDPFKLRPQCVELLLRLCMLRRAVGILHLAVDDVFDHSVDGGGQVFSIEHLLPLLIDDAALGVHHVVIFQNILTDLEIAALHRFLRVFNRAGKHLCVNGRVLVNAETVHHIHDPLGAEQAHDVVLQREEKPCFAGVALASRTAAELIVDSPGLMPLRTDDKQAARCAHLLGLLRDLRPVPCEGLLELLTHRENFRVLRFSVGIGLRNQLLRQVLPAQLRQRQILRVAAQHDIRATAGHVRGDGHGAQLARLRHDLRLAFMVLRVQNRVLHAFALQQFRQQLGFLDGNRTNQHRLPLLVAALDLLDDRAELAGLSFIYNVVMVDTDDRLVGRNLHDIQIVDRGEFLLLGQRGARHTGELPVETEQVLEGDGGQRFVLAGDAHAFLGLYGLVQALVVAAAVHQSSGEFVDDDDLPVLDDIVDIPLHDAAGLHCLIDVVRQRGVFHIRQVFNAEVFLGLGDAGGGQGDGAGLFIDVVIAVQVVLNLLFVRGRKHLLAQAGHKEIRHFVELRGLFSLAGDDQGGSGLVDEDGVHLVHNHKVVAALHHVALVERHIVAQIIKAKLIIGAVGDVRRVGLPPFLGFQIVNDQADGQTQKTVDLAHPLRVALGKIVVDGDDMHALPGQRIEIGRQDGHKGLAFAGFHLGNAPLMQDNTADELHAVRPHPQHPVGSLPADCESLRKKRVQRLPGLITSFEFTGLFTELLVRELCHLRAERFDPLYLRQQLFDFAFRSRTE